MGGNATGPMESSGLRCDTWSMESCPCPRQCSNNGECVDGECYCYPKFQGEDCSELTPNIIQPAVLIPVAIATAVLVVTGMIMYQIFGNGNRCTRLKPDDEEGAHRQPD